MHTSIISVLRDYVEMLGLILDVLKRIDTPAEIADEEFVELSLIDEPFEVIGIHD
jgi:hypothetical protein